MSSQELTQKILRVLGYSSGSMFQFLVAVFAVTACILICRCLTVDSFLFPTGLCATYILSTVHTMGTPIHFPTWVEPKVMAYGWHVQAFSYHSLNESQSCKVILCVESLATPPPWMNHAITLPDPNGFGMHVN